MGILAETVSLDGGLLAILLAIFIAVVVLTIAAIVLGAIWARRAGRGSSLAAVGFGVVATAEAFLAVVGAMNQGLFMAVLFGAALALHVALYLSARMSTPAQPSPPPPPPPPTATPEDVDA